MSVIWNIEFVSLHLSTGSNSTERDTFHISITCDHTRQGHCYYTGCMPATSKVIFKLKSTDDFVSWPTMLVSPDVHPSSILCRNVLRITLFNAHRYNSDNYPCLIAVAMLIHVPNTGGHTIISVMHDIGNNYCLSEIITHK